ncbi:MAG: hypothetical protein JSW37_05990 [Anaerolineales bacterium]|nr:MAG: hypothetical protein JSW37_05990 [Anaerolineales bacterium]
MSQDKCSTVNPRHWQIVVPFALFVVHALLFRSWINDDAGISFAYARSLIHGCGLVSQCGVEPVEGFSNPLWTLLISPVFAGNPADPTLAIKLVSLALVFGTFVMVDRSFQCLFGRTLWWPAATVAVCALLSLNTSFVVWTTSGLENCLYALLMAWYSLVMLEYAVDEMPRPNHLPIWAGVAAAGLALTRPDGVVFLGAFPALLASAVLIRPSRAKSAARDLVTFLTAAGLPVALYVCFRYTYFGDVYPNTYYAKGGPSVAQALALLLLRKQYIIKTYDLLDGVLSWRASWVSVLLFALFRYRLARSHKPLVIVSLALPLVFSWAVYCLLPDDWMREYRFATPFFLTLYVFVTGLLAEVLSEADKPSFRGRWLAFLLAAALLLMQSAKLYLPRSARFSVRPEVPFSHVAVAYGLAFNSYATELRISNASLLCPDLGGTLYYSEHRVYDLAGLCDRTIARLIRQRDSQALRDYILEELKPTFIHVHDRWSVSTGIYGDPRFRELYATIKEVPSEWAQAQGYSGAYSGDYVRKDAVPLPEDLDRLRVQLRSRS